MLLFALVQIAFSVAAVYFGGKVAMSFGRDLRKNLFHKVTDFSAREVGTFGAPSLITRITNDVQQVQMLVVLACTMAIAAPITMVVGVIMALRQDVGLSVILVVAMPVAAIVLGLIVSQMVPAFRLMQERIDQVNRVLREQITGIRVVRAFVREPQEEQRFSEANADLTEVSLRAGRLMSSMFPTVNFLINASSVGVLWLGASRVNSGAHPGRHARRVPHLPRADPHVGRHGDLHDLDDPPGVGVGGPHPGGARHRPERRSARRSGPRRCSLPATLEFHDVGFHYPGAEHPVLTGVSFSTAPGQTTAIVGSTGAGKTTLVNLILRLFDSTEGTVEVGGVDVHDLDPDVLWSTIGLVPQRPYLFSGTVASNLRYGKPDATEERDVGSARGRAGGRLRAADAGRADTPGSSRAGPTCRVANASGCRSLGRSCASPTSTCSTTRSRHSTWPPMPGCAPRSALTRRTPRW